MLSRYRFRAVILLITLAFSTGCNGAGADAHAKEYLVKNVIDGDTIELSNGRFVRYIGIDTAETMKRKGKDWKFNPEEFAQDAKRYNKTLVYGKRVRLEFDTVKEDKYGRWLAYVYLGGTMVNMEIVKKGYALVYTFPPNVKYLRLFLEAQKTALRDKNGFWGTLEVISPSDAGSHIGKYRIVRGKVINVFLSSYKISLNFGYDTRRYLTCIIHGKNFSIFTDYNIDPSSDYKDKFVEVVGIIKDENGPLIVIDNPTQIKIIESQ